MDSRKVIKAVPLKSLLSPRDQRKQRKNPYLALSTKQRLGIAATIAWSVLHLASSPWLHDDWDQTQMGILLEKTQNGKEILSQHPCASYVFSAPREAEAGAGEKFSQFIPNRAVFALGILLIELCISEPLSELRDGDGTDQTQGSLFDAYQAALSRLDEVYRLAGDAYGYATERCVKFSFEGRDVWNDFEFETFRKQFYGVVVAPVQVTYLMLPDSQWSAYDGECRESCER